MMTTFLPSITGRANLVPQRRNSGPAELQERLQPVVQIFAGHDLAAVDAGDLRDVVPRARSQQDHVGLRLLGELRRHLGAEMHVDAQLLHLGREVAGQGRQVFMLGALDHGGHQHGAAELAHGRVERDLVAPQRRHPGRLESSRASADHHDLLLHGGGLDLVFLLAPQRRVDAAPRTQRVLDVAVSRSCRRCRVRCPLHGLRRSCSAGRGRP